MMRIHTFNDPLFLRAEADGFENIDALVVAPAQCLVQNRSEQFALARLCLQIDKAHALQP